MDQLRLRRIVLNEEGSELPVIEQLINGEVVGTKKITMIDLYRVLLEHADEWMVFETVLGSKDKIETFMGRVFQYLKEYRSDVHANDLLDGMYEYVSKEGDMDILSAIFERMVAKLDVATLDIASFNRVLAGMVNRLSEVTDPTELLSMLYTLFGKVHLFDSPNKEVIKTVIRTMQERVKEFEAGPDVDEIWSHMTAKVSKNSILEAAKPHLDDISFAVGVPDRCVYLKTGARGHQVVIHVPKQRFDVNLRGDFITDVGHPHLLFWFTVSNEGQVSRPHVAAIKDEIPDTDTLLYHYPFSNVSANFSCCWTNLAPVKSLRNLSTTPYQFLTAERNFDLYTKTGDREYRELLLELSGHDFDDNFLKPSGFTLQNIIQ